MERQTIASMDDGDCSICLHVDPSIGLQVHIADAVVSDSDETDAEYLSLWRATSSFTCRASACDAGDTRRSLIYQLSVWTSATCLVTMSHLAALQSGTQLILYCSPSVRFITYITFPSSMRI